ncbi:hypothetical protein JAAARDRAFT_28910 [Jaapia argillacea MUCL 33604]|uniref:Uncharacterized protein n=1 Tax=Jaapia argillacea MUCL 33604 TaxID=933084 RepID=A0A067Q9Y5_9AGAM|nr:hypothetical protein JAAARDRAFT_28910 [Jaapia argillacea MUCL 33604]
MGQLDRALPPTSSLPPLTRLTDQSPNQITNALTNLRNVYFARPIPRATISIPKRSSPPQVKRLVHDYSVPDSGYASAEEDEEDGGQEEEEVVIGSDGEEEGYDPDVLRCDGFERAFAIKWLTGFISRSDLWLSATSDQEDDDEDLRADLLDEASSLLAKFAGDDLESPGDLNLTRTFSFPREGEKLLEVQLNDAPLSNEDHTSVGLQSWGSAIVMASRMCLEPRTFRLQVPDIEREDKALRVLELGAGTGLLSIVAAKLLDLSSQHPSSNKPEPTIVATDYHPDVLSNLVNNVTTNSPPTTSSPVQVTALDWQHPAYSSPLDEPFDIILAADVIYHPSHASWIKTCVEHLLVRLSPHSVPSSFSTKYRGGGVFWLTVPVRSTGRHEGMCDTVSSVFPLASDLNLSSARDELAILDVERVEKKEGVGRADEGGYLVFKIGWV